MYISPNSQNEKKSIFYNKEKEKENEKDKVKKSLSRILYNQKKYVKMLPTKKLSSRNIDYLKNSHKVMLRNKSNIEPTIKFASNENSLLKNDDNFMNKTKNLIYYNSDIYTPKHNKHLSSTSIYNKSKNENNKNIIHNARKNDLFLRKLIDKETTKEKNSEINTNKIFSFPISPKNKIKNMICQNPNNDFDKNELLQSFIRSQKPKISFKNITSNSSVNIFNNSSNLFNSDININRLDNSKKNNENLNAININNKNIGSYLKNIYSNQSKFINENNGKNNMNNNNYILINHLLLNDINITGNNNGNIISENFENLKNKSKTSRNNKLKMKAGIRQKIYFSNNEKICFNNGFINGDNYISCNETNINNENLDIKKKIDFYKTKKNEYNSPEENHFSTVNYLQNIKISNNNIK